MVRGHPKIEPNIPHPSLHSHRYCQANTDRRRSCTKGGPRWEARWRCFGEADRLAVRRQKSGCQETLAAAPQRLPLCLANSHLAVQAVGLAVLVRVAGPVARDFVARELKIHFPFQGQTILHFESLKRSRNVVLSGVVRGTLTGEVVEYISRQPRRQNTSA